MIVAPTPHKGRHEEQLAKIRENIKNETDIRKLNQLAEDEKTLIEKHQDTIDNTCHKICDQNPVQ